MTSCIVSIWYKNDIVCEIEPFGPWEIINPGESISFTEDWWLYDFPYSANRRIDLNDVQKLIESSQK